MFTMGVILGAVGALQSLPVGFFVITGTNKKRLGLWPEPTILFIWGVVTLLLRQQCLWISIRPGGPWFHAEVAVGLHRTEARRLHSVPVVHQVHARDEGQDGVGTGEAPQAMGWK